MRQDSAPVSYTHLDVYKRQDTNWYEPMFAAFEESHPNIKIEATNVAYSDYFTKIQQAIASGSELPTMVQQSCTLIENYKQLGVFEDLTQEPYNIDPDSFFDSVSYTHLDVYKRQCLY